MDCQFPFHRIVAQINKIGPDTLITHLGGTSKMAVEELTLTITYLIISISKGPRIVTDKPRQDLSAASQIVSMKMVWHQCQGQDCYSVSHSCRTDMCKTNQIITDTIKNQVSVYGVLITMIRNSRHKSSFYQSHLNSWTNQTVRHKNIATILFFQQSVEKKTFIFTIQPKCVVHPFFFRFTCVVTK